MTNIPDSPSVRASFDSTYNSHGTHLIDLCKSTGLRIVNGRLYKGEYTYISENGASAIDYLWSKSENFRFITDFCISDFNVWIDHSALSFSLITILPSLCLNGRGKIMICSEVV